MPFTAETASRAIVGARGQRRSGGSVPRDAPAATAVLVEGARLEILDECGHVRWLERPGAIAAALERLV